MSFAPVLKPRPAFVWLLLLALCLNTTVGMSLHVAEHGREGWAAAAAEAVAGDETAHEEEAGGHLCAGCLAQTQPAQLFDARAGWRAIPPMAARTQPETRAAFVPAPPHWRFASRDPPPPAR